MQRAELHFHLLPDVDDGPADLDDAVELARLAVDDGTSVVTVTPHVRDLLSAGILGEVPARVREVQRALDAAGVPLELRTGAELAHDALPALGADRGAAVRRRRRLPRRHRGAARARLRHADRASRALRGPHARRRR